MDWGGADLGRGEGGHETLAPASAVHLRPLTPTGSRWGQQRCPRGPDRILAFLPPPAPLPFCPLSPSQGKARDQATLWLGRWGMEVEGPVSRSQVPAGCLSWAGARLTVLGQRSREAGAPSQQAFMRLPVARRPSPHSQAIILSFTLPPKYTLSPKYTQESHQLLPLSCGPAAPRTSLDGSRAAVSSSSSSSSSSPSVNSSWLRP